MSECPTNLCQTPVYTEKFQTVYDLVRDAISKTGKDIDVDELAKEVAILIADSAGIDIYQ